MKRFLLGCFLALFCVSAFADEINIHFEKDSQPTKTRSLSVAFVAGQCIGLANGYDPETGSKR